MALLDLLLLPSFEGREIFSGRDRGSLSWDFASFESGAGFLWGGISKPRARFLKLFGLYRLDRMWFDDGDPMGLIGALSGLFRLLLLPLQKQMV